MRFSILHLGLLASIVTAAPSDIVTRDNYGVYICTGVSFGGHCAYIVAPYGTCSSFSGDLAGLVHSAGPDQGTWCTLYQGFGCTGDEQNIYYPGVGDLGSEDGKYNSVNCAAS